MTGKIYIQGKEKVFEKLKIISIVTIAALTLTGCAFDYTPKYYESDSYAYNTSYTGGVSTGLKDRTAPKGGIGNFTQTVEFGAAYTAAGFVAPALGLSGLASGGINLLDMLIDDGPDAGRSTTFAWMPLSQASSKEEAQKKMVSHVKQAMEKTFETMGLEYSKIEHKDPSFIGFYVHNDELNCPKDVKWEKWHTDYFFRPIRTRACIVRASINMPMVATTPDVRMTNNPEEKSYRLVASQKKNFNAIHALSPKSSTLPENQIYTEISKNLPEWMFIYLAPKTVALADGSYVGFPYLLNQGKAHFFVYPD
ncbi:MAG: hypothetical protein RBR82_14525 [Pseudomonas sp.]|nr:hypothetical protein [Pseudomonas sp.]